MTKTSICTGMYYLKIRKLLTNRPDHWIHHGHIFSINDARQTIPDKSKKNCRWIATFSQSMHCGHWLTDQQIFVVTLNASVLRSVLSGVDFWGRKCVKNVAILLRCSECFPSLSVRHAIPASRNSCLLRIIHISVYLWEWNFLNSASGHVQPRARESTLLQVDGWGKVASAVLYHLHKRC